MQTINVQVSTQGARTLLSINGKTIATIARDHYNAGRYSAYCGILGAYDNTRYADAVEFATSCIDRHFAQFGIDTNYINA